MIYYDIIAMRAVVREVYNIHELHYYNINNNEGDYVTYPRIRVKRK